MPSNKSKPVTTIMSEEAWKEILPAPIADIVLKEFREAYLLHNLCQLFVDAQADASLKLNLRHFQKTVQYLNQLNQPSDLRLKGRLLLPLLRVIKYKGHEARYQDLYDLREIIMGLPTDEWDDELVVDVYEAFKLVNRLTKRQIYQDADFAEVLVYVRHYLRQLF